MVPQSREAWLEARDKGDLHGAQPAISAASEFILRGLARAGIARLTDGSRQNVNRSHELGHKMTGGPISLVHPATRSNLARVLKHAPTNALNHALNIPSRAAVEVGLIVDPAFLTELLDQPFRSSSPIPTLSSLVEVGLLVQKCSRHVISVRIRQRHGVRDENILSASVEMRHEAPISNELRVTAYIDQRQALL